ncbi:MAG: hypothetical protein HS132_17455 [Planctomycetia bacterium]|nr:hypothetical protein [Planctomycetia bacterium]
MKKLLGVFFAMFVAMALTSSVHAGPADDTAPQVGDDTKFFGVSAGLTIPSLCDNYGYVWTLQVAGPGQLTGTVNTGTCGTYNVTGTFDAVNVQLIATSRGGCCGQFAYTGKHTGRSGKTASGSWTNTCGGRGSWTMAICK